MRQRIKALAALLLPSYLVRELLIELRMAFRRARYSRGVRRRMSRLDGCRVNIGCGGRPTKDWVNFDAIPGPGVDFWDCRRGLPFADNAVAAIYLEHVFEHFDLEAEAKPFLRECLRCLRPGGILRIVVPDAGAYLRAYGGPWEPLSAMRPLNPTADGWRDAWVGGDLYRTQMQLINAVFRQYYEHKYAYDEETLQLVLRDAGFSPVTLQSYGRSLDPNMAPDFEARQSESLYVEGSK
jgi:SAM-dependent methyltransferase